MPTTKHADGFQAIIRPGLFRRIVGLSQIADLFRIVSMRSLFTPGPGQAWKKSSLHSCATTLTGRIWTHATADGDPRGDGINLVFNAWEHHIMDEVLLHFNILVLSIIPCHSIFQSCAYELDVPYWAQNKDCIKGITPRTIPSNFDTDSNHGYSSTGRRPTNAQGRLQLESLRLCGRCLIGFMHDWVGLITSTLR